MNDDGTVSAVALVAPIVDVAAARQVELFLYEEAALLDGRRFEEWLDLFTDDASYAVPLRLTREGQADSEISETGRIFWDSKATLAIRVQRLMSEYAWAEQPPSRTRHFVTNVRVGVLEDGNLEVKSNVLVYVNRGDDPRHELYSGDRHDVLVPLTDGEYKIDSRWFVVDQANMVGNSLSVFL